MVAGYFMPGQGESFEYDDLQRRKRLADAMIMQGSDFSPVQSWTQGAARLAQALSGSLQREYAARLGQQAAADYNKKMSPITAALMGGGGPAPSASPMPARTAAAPSGDSMATLISSESGGNWQAQNNAVGAGGQRGHYGRLQFGHARLEDAKRAGVIPQDVTPQQFMANPEMQKAVEAWHFSDIDNRIATGPASRAIGTSINGVPVTPEGLRAVAHLGGVGGMNRFVQSGGQYNPADVNGTTLMEYMRRHGGAAPAPTQVAQAPGVPPGPVASDAPPMAYAPGQQAISAAMPQTGPVPPPAPRGQQLTQNFMQPPPPAPQPTGNVQAAMMAILSDPRFSPQQKAQAMQMYQMGQRDEGLTTVDLGDRVALMNRRGQVVREMPKTRDGADWQIVKDNDGNPIARFNARSGTTEPLSGTGLPQGGTKSPTVQRIKQPDGSEVAVQWDSKGGEDGKGAWVPLNAPQGGNPVANPKLTEVQSKDVGFYNRGASILPRLEKQDKALTDSFSALGGKIPVVGNFLKSDAYRQAEQTGRELLAVILRKDTGAAVTDSEMQLYSNMYLPQPGDDASTIRQKQEGRKTAIEGIRMGLGTAEILFRQREALDAARRGGGQTEAPPAEPKVRRYNPATGRIE
jgi:hypothetical protein